MCIAKQLHCSTSALVDTLMHVCYSLCSRSLCMCALFCGCCWRWWRGERKNNAYAALSSVMAPQAPCLSGLLCAASLSFITGHDGLHQLILTEQETSSSCLSASLAVSLILSTSVCLTCHIALHVQGLWLVGLLRV